MLVEGAGSASEINLRANDIANMGFARATGTPVVVVGDIDRGGVIASLVGTQAVLPPDDAAMIRGFIVNRMRGDASLFADGMAAIAQRTGWPALGLVPFFAQMHRLPAEDAADLAPSAPGTGRVRIAVPLLPCIANFDDLDPLAAEPDLDVVKVPPGTPLPVCALVILPGSKATLTDLAALRAEGWDIDVLAHHRRGGRVLGLCGGYQMLGRRINDPAGIEGQPGGAGGLGLLDVATVLTGEKRLAPASGRLTDGSPFTGYENAHGPHRRAPPPAGPCCTSPTAGRTARCRRMVASPAPTCTACSPTTRGGAASSPAWARQPAGGHHAAEVEAVLDAWAVHLEAHVDIDRLLSLAA